jgi:hypothetical protein
MIERKDFKTTLKDSYLLRYSYNVTTKYMEEWINKTDENLSTNFSEFFNSEELSYHEVWEKLHQHELLREKVELLGLAAVLCPYGMINLLMEFGVDPGLAIVATSLGTLAGVLVINKLSNIHTENLRKLRDQKLKLEKAKRLGIQDVELDDGDFIENKSSQEGEL